MKKIKRFKDVKKKTKDDGNDRMKRWTSSPPEEVVKKYVKKIESGEIKIKRN